MRELAERAYFGLCRAVGRGLRAARYSKTEVVGQQVRKRRAFYAPALIWLSVPLIRILGGGVRVLPHREWEERERRIFRELHGGEARVDARGTLFLPRLPGKTLASLLEDPELDELVRKKAIERVVVALAELHRMGFTHADAMAENVLVDLDSGAAHWFDFETVHDSSRSTTWSRSDDLRALLATCLLRTAPERFEETLRHVLEVYADEQVTRELAASFSSVWRRPLALHLLQAGLSYESFRRIGPSVAAYHRRS